MEVKEGPEQVSRRRAFRAEEQSQCKDFLVGEWVTGSRNKEVDEAEIAREIGEHDREANWMDYGHHGGVFGQRARPLTYIFSRDRSDRHVDRKSKSSKRRTGSLPDTILEAT